MNALRIPFSAQREGDSDFCPGGVVDILKVFPLFLSGKAESFLFLLSILDSFARGVAFSPVPLN